MAWLSNPSARLGLWPHLQASWDWNCDSSQDGNMLHLSPQGSLTAESSLECLGLLPRYLLFRGSDGGKATERWPQMLIRRLSRRWASSFLRDRQGFGFMVLVCTKDLRLLSPDMQLKHASWPLNGIPTIPQLLPREFPRGEGVGGGKLVVSHRLYSSTDAQSV